MSNEKTKQNVGYVGAGPVSARKNNNGITLIALIITIIVMLILVGVTVTVALNGGLFRTAKDAKDKTSDALAIENRLDSGKVKVGDNWYASYQDYLDGIILEQEIILEGKIVLKIEEGYDVETSTPVTGELNADLNGIEGTINWSIDNEEVATISAEGTKVVITAVGIGTATIKATCEYEGETYEATCEVTVKVPAVLQVGSYVHYEVTYKDVYSTTMPKFTADNGWRYLGTDSSGNYLLVSTGIPAKLSYTDGNANTIGNKTDREDGGGNDWWATTADILALETTSQYYTDQGYDPKSGYPNRYAAYGMRYKFESIPFAKSSSATYNAGCYTEIDSETTAVNGSVFRAEGYEDGTKVQIRSLTYEDIKRVVSGSETGSASGFKDITGTDNVALGLFDMYDLTDYGTSTRYNYWLGSPYSSVHGGVHAVRYDIGNTASDSGYTYGVRPVVVLASQSYQIVDSDDNGIFEITAAQ